MIQVCTMLLLDPFGAFQNSGLFLDLIASDFFKCGLHAPDP